jgi:hypothetical protein
MIIHCGSNDLTEVKIADLIHDISADIIRFKLLLPNTKIVWSDILMRRYWKVYNCIFPEIQTSE